MFQIKLVQKIKIHILHAATFFFSENPAVYEIKPKNMVEPKRPHPNMAARFMLD
jgi:hypothetical protein